jgi:hypothetical protein
MDWKWWVSGSDQPACVITRAHKINPDAPGVRVIGQYLAPTYIWPKEHWKLFNEKVSQPVYAVRTDGYEIIVSELRIEDCLQTDPRAARTLINLVALPLDFRKINPREKM